MLCTNIEPFVQFLDKKLAHILEAGRIVPRTQLGHIWISHRMLDSPGVAFLSFVKDRSGRRAISLLE
jgi:hypothetical protein